jgi:CRISPR-associated endoribonuclease Cas6
VTFHLLRLRLHFTAADAIHFPSGSAGNILRGAFGTVFRDIACVPQCPGRSGRNIRECEVRATCAYAQTFEPAAIAAGPSGLSDHPRPFVFRANHLDGQTIAPGEPFWFDTHLFETNHPPTEHFIRTFTALAGVGFGLHRSRAQFVAADAAQPVSIALDDCRPELERIRIEFKTPTELKSAGAIVTKPEFGILFARIRDRISTLRALYGGGPLEIDFRALAGRAQQIRMTRCDIHQMEAARRSSKTSQVHTIGGFTGAAEYEGALSEFLPYLETASWTGVGRHCVWGNGEISHHPA